MPEQEHYVIRPALPRDIPVLIAMFNRTMPLIYKGIVPDELFPERLGIIATTLWREWTFVSVLHRATPGEALSLAEIPEHRGCGDPDGVGGLVHIVNDSHIGLLWLDDAFRGHGCGASLLDFAERHIAGTGHEEATLEVYAENTEAVKFYKHKGWKVSRRYVGEVGALVLAMHKELAG